MNCLVSNFALQVPPYSIVSVMNSGASGRIVLYEMLYHGVSSISSIAFRSVQARFSLSELCPFENSQQCFLYADY